MRPGSEPAGTTKFHRFMGVSLSGGKTDKACVAIVEYYPEQKKVFLARLYEKVKGELPLISVDYKLHEILKQYEGQAELLAFDVPLSWPVCLDCQLKCPGYETCGEAELKWFRKFYDKINQKKKPARGFTPYTQRCVDTYLSFALEEKFDIQHAMGSNMAPLTARAHFLARRLDIPKIEVNPRISIWRLGLQARVSKSHLRGHKHAVTGPDNRRSFLSHFADRSGVFVYQQDMKSMIENNHAFEAFICAYTAYLSFLGETEKRPDDFPASSSWVEFPTGP